MDSNRRMPPKYELIRIARNVIRIVVTGAPIVLIIVLLEDTQFTSPLWLTIALGAILGGCVFVPAKEIGHSIWAMVVFDIERHIGKPEPGEDPGSAVTIEYEKWVRRMRTTSVLRLMKQLFPKSLKPVSYVTAVLLVATTLTVVLEYVRATWPWIS